MDHHWHLKGVDKVILPVIEQILIGVPQTFGEKEALFPMDREWTKGRGNSSGGFSAAYRKTIPRVDCCNM